MIKPINPLLLSISLIICSLSSQGQDHPISDQEITDWHEPTGNSGSRSNLHVLDSIIRVNIDSLDTTNFSKRIYVYDTINNRVTEEITQYWDTSGWGNSIRKTYTYGANDLVTHFLQESYTNGQWVNSFKWDATYNSNGDQTSHTPLTWDGSQWTSNGAFQIKTLTTYNSNNDVTLIETFDGYTGQWVNSTKTEYTYDSNDDLETIISSSWDNNQWEHSNKSEYTNTGGLATHMEQFSWDNNQWEPFARHDYTYNANNQQTEWVEEWYFNNQWSNSRKFESIYDANGNKTDFKSFSWFNTTWDPMIHTTYVYDLHHNAIDVVTHSNWNGSAWILGDHYESTFDLNIDSNAVLDPYWIGGSKKLDQLYQSWNSGNWNSYAFETFYYRVEGNNGGSTATDDQDDMKDFSVHIYPNPTQDLLHISTTSIKPNQVQLFDMYGRLVLSEVLLSNQAISLSNIESGSYLLRVGSNNAKSITKMVQVQR